MSVSMAARALLYDRQAKLGLVGSVFRQDPNKGAVFVDRVTVPIVDFASDRADPIDALDAAEAGRYLIQFALPNGQIMTENFDIKRGEETRLLVDLPHEGPHEWSSLQAMTGQFAERAADPGRAGAVPGGGKDYAALRHDPERGFQLRFINLGMAGTGDSLLRSDTLPRLATLIDRDVAVNEAEMAVGGGIEVMTPAKSDNAFTLEDGDFALFEFVYEGSMGDGAQRGDYVFGPGTDLARAYLLEKSARGARLICLPAPWTTEAEEYEIQLLLDKRSLDGEPDYTLTIAHPMINTALGYVRNGALHQAARLIDYDTARELLFRKISSPLAATIGGYLLVLGLDRSAYASKSDEWKNWIDNLCGWFEWLPDGAILKSAKYFVLGDKERDAAYEALMTAYDRGLPFFTFGLNLMLEGMRRFANEGEADAKERLEILETIASVADPSHNFLSIAVSQRWPAERL